MALIVVRTATACDRLMGAVSTQIMWQHMLGLPSAHLGGWVGSSTWPRFGWFPLDPELEN